MSKGWESKSVEEHQAEQAEKQSAASSAQVTSLDEAIRKRERQTLEMQRERILSEKTSSPHRRSALTNALADIEEKLSELGWSIHL